MDELIRLVQQLKQLRSEHPALAVRQSEGAIRTAVNALTQTLVAINQAVELHREEQASNIGLASLPGFVDFTVPVQDDASPAAVTAVDLLPGGLVRVSADVPVVPAATEQLDAEGLDDDEDYDDEDYDDEPVPAAELTAEVQFDAAPGDIRAALDAVMQSVTDNYTGYQIQTVTADGATLTAPDDCGIPAGSLPNGTEVFRGAVPATGATVTLRIAGDIDPENLPLDPVTFTDQLLEDHAAIGDEVAEVEEIRIVLERQDEAPLTVEQAETVVPTAVRALSSLLGAHEVIRIGDGEYHAQKVAYLRPVGAGQLDRRALTLRVAQFDGILPFPGIGRVRAYAAV